MCCFQIKRDRKYFFGFFMALKLKINIEMIRETTMVNSTNIDIIAQTSSGNHSSSFFHYPIFLPEGRFSTIFQQVIEFY